MDSIGMLLEASSLLPQSAERLAQPPQAGGKQPTSPVKPARRNSPLQLPEYLPEAPNDGDFGLNRLPERGNGYELLLAKKRSPDPESKDGSLLPSPPASKNTTSRVGRQRQPSQKVVEARKAEEAAKNAKNSSKRSPKQKPKLEGAAVMQSPLAMGTTAAAAAESAGSGSGSASDLPAPAAGGSSSSSATSTSSDDEDADDPADSESEASEPSSEASDESDASEASSDSDSKPARRRRGGARGKAAASGKDKQAATPSTSKSARKAKSGKRSGGGSGGGAWSRLHNRNRVPEAQLKLIQLYEDQIRRAGELPESGEEDSSDDEPLRIATAKKVAPIVPMPLAAPTAPLELSRAQTFITELTERLHKNPRELDGVVLRFQVPVPVPAAPGAASGAGARSSEQGDAGAGVDGRESKSSRAQRKRKRESAAASTPAAAAAGEDDGDATVEEGSRLRPRRTKKPRLAAPGEDQDGGKEATGPATAPKGKKVRGKFDGKSAASAPGPLNLVMVAGAGISGRDTVSKSPFAGRTADEFMSPSPTPAASPRRASSATPVTGRSSRRARSTAAGAGAGAGAGSGGASAGSKVSAFSSLLRAASSPLPAELAVEEEHSPDAAPSSSSSASSSVLDLLAPRLPTPVQTPLHLQRPASPPRLIRHSGSGGLHVGVSLYLDLQPFGYGFHPSFSASPPTPFQHDLGHRAASAAAGAGAGAGSGSGPAVGLRFTPSLRPSDILLPGAAASRGLTSPLPAASVWAPAPASGSMLHTADRGTRPLQCFSPPPPNAFRTLFQHTAAAASASARASPAAGVGAGAGAGAGSGVEERASPVFLFGPQQLHPHSAVQGILGTTTDLRSPSPGAGAGSGAGLPSLLPARDRAATPTFARGTNFVLKRD